MPDDGDTSLIRWMLSLSPEARLAVLQGFVDSAAELTDLEARYRDPGGRDLRPEMAGLAGDGHHLLLTRCGPVEVQLFESSTFRH